MKEMTQAEFDTMIDALDNMGVSVSELHPCGDCGDWDDFNEIQTGCRGGRCCVDSEWCCKQFAQVNNIKIVS